ncbi:MAG TPA: GTPase Era [Bacillota bacterium]|nr:GTPase Era [Bacillota bacterium]
MSEFRSGFVAIIGRSNVGKSTLMNSLTGQKVAIVSDKPQTTRNRIQAVLTKRGYQIVFVDTPGIHKPKNKLGKYMVKAARNSLGEMDVILFLVDVADGIGYGDRMIAESLKDSKAPVFLVANKMDIANVEAARNQIAEFEKTINFDSVIQVSAATHMNLSQLKDKLYTYMPPGPKYYPDDMITDQPERVIISELIREKALQLLMEEVPHGIGVEIEAIEERPDRDLVDVRASVICEKASHKGMVIGKGGKMLRNIGSRARIDIENLLGAKVYLELFVKVKNDWRNNQNTLKDLGYGNRNI